MRTRVAIACQGGGSHTAFTAGVLDRLCSDVLETHEVVGFSGTSGGAVCALLAWYALRDDDPAAAGRLLDEFWADNSASSPWEQLLNASAMVAGDLQQFVVMPAISPYDNVLAGSAAEEFKAMLRRRVDFARVGPGPEEPVLVIGAVDVLSGGFRAFDSRRDRISADIVLASAAIPTLFRAVSVDDGTFWDGLFSQNPPIRELVTCGRTRSGSFRSTRHAVMLSREPCLTSAIAEMSWRATCRSTRSCTSLRRSMSGSRRASWPRTPATRRSSSGSSNCPQRGSDGR